MRWLLYVLAVPFVLLLGLMQSFEDHPPVPVDANTTAASSLGIAPSAPSAPLPTINPSFTGPLEILDHLMAAAKSWVGTRYHWGGCSHTGIDCSCFVQLVYAAVGISVPRTTATQVAVEVPISRDQLRLGDSLFFNDTCVDCGSNPTHVGLYVDRNTMIDCGDPCKLEPIYWSKFAEAGRPRGL